MEAGGEDWEGDFQCPECGNIVSSEDTTCPACDTAFEEEAFVCPSCGEQVDGLADSCRSCGELFGVGDLEDEDDLGGEEPEVIEDRDEHGFDGMTMGEDEYEVVSDDDGIGPYVRLGDDELDDDDELERRGEEEDWDL